VPKPLRSTACWPSAFALVQQRMGGPRVTHTLSSGAFAVESATVPVTLPWLAHAGCAAVMTRPPANRAAPATAMRMLRSTGEVLPFREV